MTSPLFLGVRVNHCLITCQMFQYIGISFPLALSAPASRTMEGSSILVAGSDVTLRELQIYFQKTSKSGGGEVEIEACRERGDGSKIIVFEDPQVAAKVCSRSHLIETKDGREERLHVQLYKEEEYYDAEDFEVVPFEKTDELQDNMAPTSTGTSAQEPYIHGVEVHGLTDDMIKDEKTFFACFSDGAIGRGGELEREQCYICKYQRTAIIAFKDARVAERVCKSEVYEILGNPLKVTSAHMHPRRQIDERRIVIHGFQENDSTESLKLFIGHSSKSLPEDVQINVAEECNKALIVFPEDKDIDKTLLRVKERMFHEKKLSGLRVYKPTALILTGIPPEVHNDDICLELEIRLDIDVRVNIDSETGEALVDFLDHNSCQELLKNPPTILNKYHPRVHLYHKDHDMTEPPMPIYIPSPFSVEAPEPAVKCLKGKDYYRLSLEDQLKARRAKSTWEGINLLIQTENLDGLDKRGRTTWRATASECVETAFQQFVSRTITRDREPSFRELCSTLDIRGNYKSVVEIGDMNICLWGKEEDVERDRDMLSLLISEKEKEHAQRRAIVEEHIQLIAWQSVLLTKRNHFEWLRQKFPSIRIQCDGEGDLVQVHLSGMRAEVCQAKKDIEDTKLRMKQKVIENVSNPKIHFLLKANAQQYMNQFADATYTVDGVKGKLIICAIDSANISKAEEKFRDLVQEVSIPATEDVLKEEDFLELIRQMERSRIVSIQLYSSNVIVTGSPDAVDVVSKEIRRYIQDNSNGVEELNVGHGVAKFILIHRKEQIKKTTSDSHVSILPHGQNDSIIVLRGKPSSRTKANSAIRELAQKVVKQDFPVPHKPGIVSYFQQGPGKEKLHGRSDFNGNSVESRCKCVISQDVRVSPKPKPNTLSVASYKLGNKQMSIFSGDIFAHAPTVDAIVINNKFDFSIGLPMKLVEKGGTSIKEAFEQKLFDGDMGAILTHGGSLGCRVVHLTADLQRNDVISQEFQMALCEAFLKCEEHGISSVAFTCMFYKLFVPEEYMLCILQAVEDHLEQNPSSKLREYHIVEQDEEVVDVLVRTMTIKYGPGSVTTRALHGDGENEDLYPPAAAEGIGNFTTGQQEMRSSMRREGLFRTVQGLMQEQRVDTIVNSANRSLNLDFGALSRGISAAGGFRLQNEVRELAESLRHNAEPGEVYRSCAGNLPCRLVLHAIVPEFQPQSGNTGLTGTIQKCLVLAEEKGCRSVAFPALGAGAMGFPPDTVAAAFYDEIGNYYHDHPHSAIKDIRIVLHPKDAALIKAFKPYQTEKRSPEPTETVKLSKEVKSKKGDVLATKMCNKFDIRVEEGDIADDDSDCIVNPTNEALCLDIGGVSKAIRDKAGPELEKQLQVISRKMGQGGLNAGNVVVTKHDKGQLRSKVVIHVILPLQDDAILEKGYLNCLREADKYKMKSICFPIIGTGYVGNEYMKVSLQALLRATETFSNSHSPKHVRIVKIKVFGSELYTTVWKYLSTLPVDDQSRTARIKRSLADLGKKLKNRGTHTATDQEERPTASPNQSSSLTFVIYAGSQEAIDKTKQELSSLIKEEFKTEEMKIDNEKLLHYLIEHADLQIVEAQFSVDIEVKSEAVALAITGSESARDRAQKKINIDLQDARQFTKGSWYMKVEKADDSEFDLENGDFSPIEHISTVALEKALEEIMKLQSNQGCSVDIRGGIGKLRRNADGTLTLEEGGRSYKVIRRENSPDVNVPLFWENPKIKRVLDLEPESREYKYFKSCFLKTYRPAPEELGAAALSFGDIVNRDDAVNIIKIQRIETPNLYRVFALRKKDMVCQSPKERLLFHGTKESSCIQINQHGLDRNYAGDNVGTLYGKGSYFAVNSRDSANYATPSSDGTRYMYMVRVLTGDFVQGKPKMKNLPNKEGTSVQYDSAANDEHNPTIFVSFHDASTYPAYLIQYKDRE